LLFNSYIFLLGFLPITLAGFYALSKFGHRLAAAWIAAASLFFYAWWNPPFVLLLVVSIAFNFGIGQLIARRHAPERLKTGLLALGIAGNLGLLFWFKYLYSLLSAMSAWGIADIAFKSAVLPLGISFFTFTQIGYLIDVKQGVTKDNGLLSYLLFVTFFPHLIAGPILHNREMMPQFADRRTYRFSAENFSVGLTVFVIGLLKKCLLADPFSETVQAGFVAPASLPFFSAWYAVICYSFQLYFDFSGYSDMAIGLARMFNVRFPLNFNSPYKATGIIDYWQRFHMTLTRYLTLCVFNPLALWITRRRVASGKDISRKANATLGGFGSLVLFPTMTTMTLAGIWHGAGLQFLVFGVLHGIFISVNHAWRSFGGTYARADGKLIRGGCVLLTYFCASIGFVFFRAPSLEAAFEMLAGMAGLHGAGPALPVPEALAATGTLFDRWTAHGLITPAPLGVSAQNAANIFWIAVMYAVVWALPNTQQFMTDYAPALGKVQPGGALAWLRWRMSAPWAVAFGVGAVLGLLSLGGTTEFLYFQF
jgi:alginate O-acetyltransferase complex protein AlgI